MEKIKKIIVPVIAVIILLGLAALLYLTGNNLSKDKAIQKAMDYINNIVLQGQATATLLESKIISGVYQFKLKIGEQEYTSYITKNGKLLFSAGIEVPDDVSAKQAKAPQKDKPQALLFVMSFCPYGNQAEELMIPVVDLLKDKADIGLHYVIYENYNGGGKNYCLDPENKYCSMHGIQELNQDVRELCVQKYQSDKFWSFVKQVNASCTSKNVDTCWEGAASKTGIDIAEVKACQKNEAIGLLKQEVELNTKYSISGSPQLVINDTEFNGSRSAEAFKSAICSGFNTAPSECSTTLGTDSEPAPSGGCH
jgi:glutaredoxin